MSVTCVVFVFFWLMIPQSRSTDLPTTAQPSEAIDRQDSPEPFPKPVPGSSQILCIESCFPPSKEKDCMYDGIIDYLKTRTYPPFLKLTSNRQIAKIEFSSDCRKKCETFLLDKHGELVEGRAKGLERHVLRRGELAYVMKFIHEVLGHCSADVCVKVAQPVVYSSEPFDIAAYSVIKRCQCRDKNSTVRWFPCPVDYAKHIALVFVRKANGGYLLNIRSTSDEVDLGHFRMTVPRPTKGKIKPPEVLIDGRYRINDRIELEDVLDKLHLAFGHCGPNHLRILFKSRFHYPCFFVAAREICARCWFCKLETHRKHFQINDYGYDIEVKPAKEDQPRIFMIYPRDVTTREVTKYINETLRQSRENLGMEAAAVIANGAGLGSPPSKKSRTNVDETVSACRAIASDRPNICFRYKRNVVENYRPQYRSPPRRRLIPPSEISLGPVTTTEGSDTDSSMSRNSSQMSGGGDANYSNACVKSYQNSNCHPIIANAKPAGYSYQVVSQPSSNQTVRWDTSMNNMSTSYVDNSYYIADDTDGGQYSCELNDTCMPLVEPANYIPNDSGQVVNDAFYEDISDLQPTSSQCVPYLMDYNADFTCEPISPNTQIIVEDSGNAFTDPVDVLEDLGDLSSFFGNIDASSVL
ncbi:hypothetical protein Y032_0081g1456 [Ancylostoma ceylanicum]|uniref:Uncharacterized protein n=1 Tax=Ancylostoma ceylanicum TaxID=53326 RepID=A0A016TS73_9BILA|nr:hypothetical protein Y032_0081g1456 [Ancylostoma ceylanicum]